MRLLIVAAFVFACLLIAQGIYIYRTGVVALFLIRQPASARLPTSLQRIGYAAIHIFSGLAIISLLAATAKRRFSDLTAWLSDHGAEIFWLGLLTASGICTLFWPSIPVKWARTAHPQLADDDSILLIARVIGAVQLGIAIFIFVRL